MTLSSDIAQIAADTVIFHDVVNGDASETVMTESGAVDTLAAAISKIGAVNYRGDWTAVTAYAIGDAVAWSGALYRCIIAHTSGNNVVLGPTQDAADWVVQNAQPANVTNAQMADMATARIKGRSSAGTGDPEDLTGAQVADLVAPSLRFGLRNAIINGCFRKWDYATSQTTSGYGSANNWISLHNGSTKTTSRQAFTLGQTDVPGEPVYFHRTVVTSSAGAANYAGVGTRIESVRTLAGKTATLSFYAKADSSKNIAVNVIQAFGSGGSPSDNVTVTVTTTALTSSWAKYTITMSVPSISGKTLGTTDDGYLCVFFWLDAGSNYNAATNSLGQQSGTFDIARVRLVEGTQDGDADPEIPIGLLELLCARYLPIWKYADGGCLAVGQCVSSTQFFALIPFKVKPRVPPTAITISSSSHFYCWDAGTLSVQCVTVGFYRNGAGLDVYCTVASGLVAGNATHFWVSDVNGYLYATGCEL